MPRSSKKILNCLPKTIKLYSQRLGNKTFLQLSDLMSKYGQCKNMFYQQLCGINNMITVINWRKLRNKITKSGLGKTYIKQYGFQNRHWHQALFDVCNNLNSMWSNLANKIKHTAQSNGNLNDSQRHYLNFILSFRVLWYTVLHYQDVYQANINSKYLITLKQIKLSNAERHKVEQYIRRLTRRYKPYPKVNQNRAMTYEENMYSIHNHAMVYEENMYLINDHQINLTSCVPNRTFKIPLTSDWRYSKKGNLQIILDYNKQRLEIHKLIKSHFRKINQKQEIGVDKGLATLLSVNTGNEYGKEFSSFINKHTNYETKHSASRHPYLMKRYALRQKLSQTTNVKKEASLQRQLLKLNNNIGFKQYRKQQNKFHAALETRINHAIKEMIINEKPKLIIKEDLTFASEKLPKVRNRYLKRIRKRLNSWTKGQLDKRIEYQADLYQIKYVDINPAYTSQYCPICNHKFKKRYGRHHELTYCSNCGEMNANIAAGKNIKNRYYDQEINLYTPYKKVKEILDKRVKI